MATVVQATEWLRGRGKLPPTGIVTLTDLHKRFPPSPRGSVRALLSSMLAKTAVKAPWAVILCRFKGQVPNPAVEAPIEQFYRGAFTQSTGGLVEYWRDVSLGMIDISGSKVFGWLEVAITRDKAGGGPKDTPPGPGRSGLVDAAIKAAQVIGNDPITGFQSQISVYTENWSNDDPTRPPGTPIWTANDPLKNWWPTWIDGSADWRGKVNLTPPHNGNITAHEMGHGFGMQHDVGPDLTTVSDYSDPACIMSQQGPFLKAPWNKEFGPALCLPHLVQKNWFLPRRLHVDDGHWMSTGTTIPLAPITHPQARANLGIRLRNIRADPPWDYYLEYCAPTEWNQGVPGAPCLLIRRLVDIPGVGQRAAYLMPLRFNDVVGARAMGVEPSGNVQFSVEVTNLPGRILKVTAEAL